MDLDAKVLKSLIDIMQRDGLDRLRVRLGDLDVDLRMSLPQSAAIYAPARESPEARVAAQTPAPSPTPANIRKVVAPLVGVFYRAPAPAAKPFVELGDTVTGGQVLCILEAMKLMNEIVSEYDGKIVKICVDDGELVSLRQDLFWIES